ncbi:helix-turn-helix transcriptional regulator [Nocardia sp. NPDC050710]|uniref:helix-turn-helix domain-containing protein n=1 Tax=Nocardia sp. NPDC050710 TaxID=3157220 RepID=UPI0033C92CD1
MTIGPELREARETAGISLRAMARRLHYSPAYLSRIERGQAPIPAEVIAAYQRELGAALTADAAGRSHLGALTINVDTRRLRSALTRPEGAGAATVADLAVVLHRVRHLEDSTGSAWCLPIVRGLDELALSLTAENITGAAHLTAHLARYRGWLELDTRHPATADRCFDRAAALAADLGDPMLAAHALSFRAYSARRQGNPAAAVLLTEAALAVPGRHPVLAVYDHYQAAELAALTGDRCRARTLLRVADRAADAVADEPLPAEGYWYTTGFWGVERAIVLAAAGLRRDAVHEAEQGYAALPAEHRGTGWMLDMLTRVDPEWAR